MTVCAGYDAVKGKGPILKSGRTISGATNQRRAFFLTLDSPEISLETHSRGFVVGFVLWSRERCKFSSKLLPVGDDRWVKLIL